MRLRYSLALTAAILWACGRSAQAQMPRSAVLSSAPAAADQGLGGSPVPDPRRARPSVLQTPSARQQLLVQEKQIESLTNTVQSLGQRLDRSPFQSALSGDGTAPGTPAIGPGPAPFLTPPAGPPGTTELRQTQLALQNLKQQQAAAPLDASAEELQRQLELQRKQIEVLEKMVRLLASQLEQQGPLLADMQTQVATLTARSQQAAQRDRQLASGIDNLSDQFDAQQRYGPPLPAQLKQSFLASGTNETPLSIFNALSMRYQYFPSQRGLGQFQFIEYDPIFLLQLNNSFLFESQLEVHPDGVEPEFAQIDWTVNDALTVVGGRFMTPIGVFNERLHYLWINRLPDYPIFAWQVVPAFDFNLNGVQLRGAKYLFRSSWKAEYAFYMTNGWGVPGQGGLGDFADLNGMTDQSKSINNAVAYGGRIGLWHPASGFFGGISYFGNSPYSTTSGTNMTIWDLDLNYHQGNWDWRFEGAQTFQQTGSFIGNDIVRRGFYTQIAYRFYDAPTEFLSRIEAVFRYSYADIRGVPLNQLDLTAFTFPNQSPVSRDQYTVGANYYIYPSMAIRWAYEFNKEIGGNLKDDVLLTSFTWGF